MKPGTKSLKEIRFYQWCQTFPIAVSPFQRLVHEVCLSLDGGGDLCWQSTALFALQCSTEAYMAGFWHDTNLCALHWKVVTVNHKDVWLATEIRGREHVGGRSQVSDVGNVNVTFPLLIPVKRKVSNTASSRITSQQKRTGVPNSGRRRPSTPVRLSDVLKESAREKAKARRDQSSFIQFWMMPFTTSVVQQFVILWEGQE